MVSFVLVVALLNIALGYVTAVALREPPLWTFRLPKLPRLGRRTRGEEPTAAAAEPGAHSPEAVASVAAAEVAAAVPVQPAPPTVVPVEELPADWLEQLAAEGIIAQSFVEGAAHVVRLEVGKYREHLIAAENRSRALVAAADGDALKLLIDDLRFINQDWLDKQTTAAELVSKRAGRLGEDEAAAEALEQVLLDQAAELRAIGAQLSAIDARSDPDGGGKRVLEQIGALVDHAHLLRDRIADLLATLLRLGRRLEGLGSNCQLDALTGLPGRIGLENVLATWWRDDPQRSRTLSIVQIDIDRFARVNQRLGTRAGDQTLAALARVLEETIRRDRGYDRVARIGGQAFLLVMGDTGPHEALTAAERIRQSIEAATFDRQGAEFELTLSCGVIEVGPGETITALLRRAGETVKYAKKAGRNRCALDEGSGPTTLQPPQFPVKGRVIRLGS